MFKTSKVFFLHAETGVHVGSGQSFGAVDLAVQRERHTDLPVVPASGLKGAVRRWFEYTYKMPEDSKPDKLNENQKKVLSAFGPDTGNADKHGGAVAFTDARLVLFPVRSMKGVFAWLTCPMILSRLRRDLAATGLPLPWQVPDPNEDQVLGTPDNANHTGGQVLLEEYVFDFKGDDRMQPLAEWLRDRTLPQDAAYAYWREHLPTHLLVLSDDDFRDFAKHSTEVQARVKLGEGKSTDPKKGGNLFYQENLPSDTLFYSLALAQDDLSGTLDGDGSAQELLAFVAGLDGKRLQIGGDESVGKGITSVTFLNESNQ